MARVTRVIFIVALLCVNEVVVVSRRILNSEVVLKASRDEKLDSPSKTSDLDWPGCASFRKSKCVKKTGCHYHYIWLDSPRQSCRYTDEYKLMVDQIATFFPVELARLHEKSVIFASTGCLSGGWLYKCHRRMLQIIRLFNYVRKAMDIVQKQGSEHPAYDVVSSDDTQQRLKEISANLATGFDKNGNTKDLNMKEGLKRMFEIPAEIDQAIREGEDAGMPLTDMEVASMQQAKQTSAYLGMMGNPLTADQEEILRANIEASGAMNKMQEGGQSDVIDELVSDSEDIMTLLDKEDREKFGQADHNVDEQVTELDDHELVEPTDSLIELASVNDTTIGNTAASFMQLSSRTSDGPLKIMWNKGWQGMKWLVNNGLGWLFRRIAWTLVFMISFVFSAARAFVAWPIAFGVCLTVRFLHWFFVTVMWEGKDIGQGFKNIGHCAPEMWDLVGFESENPLHSAGSQIFIQPVRTASWFSGVHHVYKTGKPDPCRPITCGLGAHCMEGFCYCNSGLVPLEDNTQCGLMPSAKGCECKEQWKSGSLTKYGCSKTDRTCEVDKDRPSYNACKEGLKASQKTDILGRFAKWALNNKRMYDTCNPVHYWSKVDPLGINETINEWGEKKADK